MPHSITDPQSLDPFHIHYQLLHLQLSDLQTTCIPYMSSRDPLVNYLPSSDILVDTLPYQLSSHIPTVDLSTRKIQVSAISSCHMFSPHQIYPPTTQLQYESTHSLIHSQSRPAFTRRPTMLPNNNTPYSPASDTDTDPSNTVYLLPIATRTFPHL